ncbi:MAG: hypothetical protein Q9M36_11350 [Sulfurovum sp.]|nr:hypothetical protein [Sulfurovum sp.]
MTSIDANTSPHKIKRFIFFSRIMTTLLTLGIFLFIALFFVLKIIVAPLLLFVQFFIFVPWVYLKTKQNVEMNLVAINMDALHDEVFEVIQEDIATFESHGFKEMKLIQCHLVEDTSIIYTQIMLNESNGIALALMYGVFKDIDGEYSEIQIRYQEFGFENSEGKAFEFHNSQKQSVEMTQRVTRLYINIDEEDAKVFYHLILDIAPLLDITIHQDRLSQIKDDPISTMKSDYTTDINHMLNRGYYKEKDGYIRLSIWASIQGIAKEMWPISDYLTQRSWKRTIKYFKALDFDIEDIDYEMSSNNSINYPKKITTLKAIETFIKKHHNNKFQILALSFYIDEASKMEEITIILQWQKPIGGISA